jgi:hypothetical protein
MEYSEATAVRIKKVFQSARIGVLVRVLGSGEKCQRAAYRSPCVRISFSICPTRSSTWSSSKISGSFGARRKNGKRGVVGIPQLGIAWRTHDKMWLKRLNIAARDHCRQMPKPFPRFALDSVGVRQVKRHGFVDLPLAVFPSMLKKNVVHSAADEFFMQGGSEVLLFELLQNGGRQISSSVRRCLECVSYRATNRS